MKITAKKVKTQDLMPGDLFSTSGDKYWGKERLREGDIIKPLGEKVYIRTEAPTPEDQRDEDIYLLTIEK